MYDTGDFNTDGKSDDSLPAMSIGSALYEIVSLPTGNVEAICVDEDRQSDGPSMNADSTFHGYCSELDQGTSLGFNLDKKLSKGEESVERNLFRKSEHCLADSREDHAVYETFSYCKIEREASCDCLEEKDCCCQCCECIGNDD